MHRHTSTSVTAVSADRASERVPDSGTTFRYILSKLSRTIDLKLLRLCLALQPISYSYQVMVKTFSKTKVDLIYVRLTRLSELLRVCASEK